MRPTLAIILLLTIHGPANAQSRAEVIQLRGRSFEAGLSSIDDDWNLHFDEDAQRQVVPLSNLIRWGSLSDRAVRPTLLLNDRSRFTGQIVAISQESVKIRSEVWSTVTIPRELIQGIVLQTPTDLAARDHLFRLIQDFDESEDRIRLIDGDELRGLVEAYEIRDITFPNGEPGIISQLLVSLDGTRRRLGRSQLSAIAFSSHSKQQNGGAKPKALIGVNDGSWLNLIEVRTRRSGIELTLSNGLVLRSNPTANPREFWRRVTSIEAFNDRVSYLSDAPPARYSSNSTFEVTYRYRLNESLTGGPLRSVDHLFRKGIAMHSDSSVVYRIEEPVTRFEAEIALDQSTGQLGSVVFKVYRTDDLASWKAVYESDVVRGGVAPKGIRIDIRDAKAIALSVERADHGQILDRANWLNARLIR